MAANGFSDQHITTDNTSVKALEQAAVNPQLNLLDLTASSPGAGASKGNSVETAQQFLPSASFLKLDNDLQSLDQGVTALWQDLTSGNQGLQHPDSIDEGLASFNSQLHQDIESMLQGFGFADSSGAAHSSSGSDSVAPSGASVASAPYSDSTIASMLDPSNPVGTDTQVAAVLQAAEPQMSSSGFAQFENIAAADTKVMGGWSNDTSLLQSAYGQFANSGGNAGDLQSLASEITNITGQNPAVDTSGSDATVAKTAPSSGDTTVATSTPTGDSTVATSTPTGDSTVATSTSSGDTTEPTSTPSGVTTGANGAWSVNFAGETADQVKQQLDTYFPVQWGQVSAENGDVAVSSPAGTPNTAVSGFMQADNSSSADQGYGTYSITAALSSPGGASSADGVGSGAYIAGWPSNNVWPGQEIDLAEVYGNPIATQHWQGRDGSNQYSAHNIDNVDVTQPNTYTMNWQPGSISEYVNGNLVYSSNTNVTPDAANGGVNESLGVGAEPSEVTGQAGSQVTVYAASFTPDASAA